MRPSLSNLGIQYTANQITSQGGERLTKFVPLEKQSKKARRAYYLQQRKGWGCLSPVTRQGKTPMLTSAAGKSSKIGKRPFKARRNIPAEKGPSCCASFTKGVCGMVQPALRFSGKFSPR